MTYRPRLRPTTFDPPSRETRMGRTEFDIQTRLLSGQSDARGTITLFCRGPNPVWISHHRDVPEYQSVELRDGDTLTLATEQELWGRCPSGSCSVHWVDEHA